MTERRTPAGDVRRPTPAQSEFLVACLDQGPAGTAAFKAWLETAVDPLAGLRDPARADRHLFALLHHGRGGEVPGELAPVLHAAVVHEQLRAEAVGAAGAEAVAALQEAGFEPLLTGGAALAWGRYDAPFLRHCHNIDLLVADADGARAALRERGAVEGGRHPSGTPVAVVSRLSPSSAEPADLAAHGVPVDLAGTPVLALGGADQLVQACANAAGRFDPGLRHLADSWILCSRPVDWRRVEEHAALARRTAPVSTVLDWLAGHGGPEAPAELRASLARSRRVELGRTLIATGPRRVGNRLRRAWRTS